MSSGRRKGRTGDVWKWPSPHMIAFIAVAMPRPWSIIPDTKVCLREGGDRFAVARVEAQFKALPESLPSALLCFGVPGSAGMTAAGKRAGWRTKIPIPIEVRLALSHQTGRAERDRFAVAFDASH